MFSSAGLLSKFSITGYRFRNNVPFVPDFKLFSTGFHSSSSLQGVPHTSLNFVRKKPNIFITINPIVCIAISYKPTLLHHKSGINPYPQCFCCCNHHFSPEIFGAQTASGLHVWRRLPRLLLSLRPWTA